jgi:hypothetical protein
MNLNLPIALPALPAGPTGIPRAGMGQAMGLLSESTGWVFVDAAVGAGVGWLVAPRGQETGYVLGGALATGLAGVFGLAGLVGWRYLVAPTFGHELEHEHGAPRIEHDASDYVAIGHHGRVVAGPFKHYDQAKREADAAGGYVKYASESSTRITQHGATPDEERALRKEVKTYYKGNRYAALTVPRAGGRHVLIYFIDDIDPPHKWRRIVRSAVPLEVLKQMGVVVQRADGHWR